MLKPSAYLLLSVALFTTACQPKEAANPAAASAVSASATSAAPTAAASTPFTTPKPDGFVGAV